MRYARFSVVVLFALVLAACAHPATSAPTPTPAPIPSTATAAPITLPTQPQGPVTAPGGVDVALQLAKIPDQKDVATVNGEAISTGTYKQELSRALYMVTSQYQVDWNDPQNQALLPTLQEQVLDQVIQRVVLRALATQEGVGVDSTRVETETAALHARVLQSGQYADWATFLAQNGMTDESVRSLISDNLLYDAMSKVHGGPTSVEQVHASHILVATQETGQEVLDKLAQGASFADLAAQYSTDTGSKDKGGDLGWFPRGVMVPEFDQVAFSLEPGKVSQLVQTQYGYHIILVQEKAVRELDPSLVAQVQGKQFQTWLEDQQAKMKVERLYTFAPK